MESVPRGALSGAREGWLDVSGKVERVAFEFSKGDGGVLQVVEQHLDLRDEKKRV